MSSVPEGRHSVNFDDQDRLLDEATAVVKEQSYYMKKAVTEDNLRDSLKYSSNMICELRTSLLSPKNYYELYMQVFQEMQQLPPFFGDKARHGRKMSELYESVQHAGNILPRLYLLVTVAACYIKSKEAPAKEILKDVSELCKGVQHPMRGLFLRYYLSQMVKDKLPDTGSEFEAEGGGDVNDAFDFILQNFTESNKLWVRIQHQGPAKDKQKREKERHDLRVLVGANLVRLSQLEGMTADFYHNEALPKIIDHIVSIKDSMSQQYLFDCIIQVFPDEYHIRSLECLLGAFTKSQPTVDLKPIMVTLMTRLATYMQNSEDVKEQPNVDIFSLFRTHLQQILERPVEGRSAGAAADVSMPLELQTAFLQFTLTLYPDKLHYVDIILGSTVSMLSKFLPPGTKLDGPGAESVVQLLAMPLRSLSVQVLEMEHYSTLLSFLTFHTRKKVAVSMVNIVTETHQPLTSVEAMANLFAFISPLTKDEPDTPADEGSDKEAFLHEQQQVCRLVHLIQNPDTDVEFDMLNKMRSHFGQGGPNRMQHTLQPTVVQALGLASRIIEREARVADGAEGYTQPVVSLKKVFQFVHKTISALPLNASEASLNLWLMCGSVANIADRASATPGAYEQICFEFLTQAMGVFEEAQDKVQAEAIFTLVGTMTQLLCLENENYDNICTKIVQHSARILKKPQSCRAVMTCCHLFWNDAKKDGKRVLECLQKCLKIADTASTTPGVSDAVLLFCEVLDQYIYFCECGCEEVAPHYIESLIALCAEHIGYTKDEEHTRAYSLQAKKQLSNSVAYLKELKATNERFATVNVD